MLTFGPRLLAPVLAISLALTACAPSGGSLYVPSGPVGPTSTGALPSGQGWVLYPPQPTSTGALGTGTVGFPAPAPASSAFPASVATGAVPVSRFGRPSPDAATADAFAIQFLDTLQAPSFAQRREFCGYFVVDSAGRISATPPVPGTLASCTQPGPGPNVFASYHTHGAYDPGYDNEVPSPEDLMGDFSFGIDGYVSTPGGRIWRVEPDVQAALLICGPGCVSVDPGFVPQDEAGILTRYTINQLRARR
jgi:hypothetical protein